MFHFTPELCLSYLGHEHVFPLSQSWDFFLLPFFYFFQISFLKTRLLCSLFLLQSQCTIRLLDNSVLSHSSSLVSVWMIKQTKQLQSPFSCVFLCLSADNRHDWRHCLFWLGCLSSLFSWTHEPRNRSRDIEGVYLDARIHWLDACGQRSKSLGTYQQIHDHDSVIHLTNVSSDQVIKWWYFHLRVTVICGVTDIIIFHYARTLNERMTLTLWPLEFCICNARHRLCLLPRTWLSTLIFSTLKASALTPVVHSVAD